MREPAAARETVEHILNEAQPTAPRFNRNPNRCTVQTGRGANPGLALSHDGRIPGVSSVPVLSLYPGTALPVISNTLPVPQLTGRVPSKALKKINKFQKKSPKKRQNRAKK
ncbi:MAG: hypothetical protein ABIS51_22170 [Sphingomonas sp.]